MRGAPSRGFCLALLTALLGTAPAPTPPQAGAEDLPVVALSAPAGTHGPLVLILTGDGNWAEFDRQLAEEAVRRGSPVLALESRTWLRRPRTPEETAAALASTVRAHLTAWGRTDLVVVGYSRGAELAPFALSRWPADLRARVRALALIGPEAQANFTFHWIDLVWTVHRADDVPVRPNLAKLAGMPIVCVSGVREAESLCRAGVAGMRLLSHPGSHRVADDGATARLVLTALGI